MTKTINITTRKQLDTYMNPQRQRLLKCMDLQAEPMTPKQISDVLKISPSSVTYHLKKLEEIGLVELQRTEMIHGIRAKFYQRIPASINLGAGMQGDLKAEKEVLADYMMNDVYHGFKKYMNNLALPEEEYAMQKSGKEIIGDMKNGILYLTDEEASELKQMIEEFITSHSTAKENTTPWEVALIAYPRKEVD